jgi:nucleoside-diphosphate-sugar epimerase
VVPRRIVVTGASGFIGRHLVEALAKEAEVFALGRGAPGSRGVSLPAGVRWLPADVASREGLDRATRQIRDAGGAEVLLHLAGHYDFTGERHPEYERTNVQGTRHVLDAARALGVRDFVFASSVAACAFPRPGEALTERSAPDGDTPYAESKRAGERMLDEYRGSFRPWVVRFAALFSDWCEYEPLFRFMETWLSRPPRGRILAGHGLSAVPYMHVRDAVAFVRALIERRDRLSPGEVLLASTDGATTHREIFEAATVAHFGEHVRPILVPRPLCRAGLWVMDAVGRGLGAPAFERPWMGRFIDLELAVDARLTRERLGWSPRARLGLVRRMPFLVQNRKSLPVEWQRRNHAALRGARRHENLRVYPALERRAPDVVEALTDYVLDAARGGRFAGLQALDRDHHVAANTLLVRALVDAVHSGEKSLFLDACREVAGRRRAEGVSLEELTALLDALNDLCVLGLVGHDTSAAWALALYDHVTMTVQFAVDAVLDMADEG